MEHRGKYLDVLGVISFKCKVLSDEQRIEADSNEASRTPPIGFDGFYSYNR